ncbi:DUF4012 domain-containing protein [Skermania sp. ID1734]|uniref:DUF4012 domain-containing protein n=1 Tax=Skermania sp. ID1734 TaxID=2597516 RepID=UPI00117EEAE6|nr:DUF4012 domain-containing protein [Skermania sp. ID1734]TSE00471.1 DUF4012 domain-containing protein [Skermania sp. ID1734]
MHGHPAPKTRHHRSRYRKFRRAVKKRRGRIVWIAVLVLVVGFGVWFAYSAIVIKRNLQEVAAHLERLETGLKSGDIGTAGYAEQSARKAAADAVNASRSIPWLLVGKVPVLGTPVHAVSEIASVAQRMTEDVIPPALTALQPHTKVLTGRSIDLGPVVAAAPSLDASLGQAEAAAFAAQQIGSGGYLTPVTDARDRLQRVTAQIVDGLRSAYTAANLAPAMLGQNGPRSYLLAFQTNAEVRGTGGLVGGVGIVRVSNGSITVDHIASNVVLRNDLEPMDLGADFTNSYGRYDSTRNWENSNISPNFPYAGEIWRNLWRQQTGETVDGTIAVDPVALSYLLDATGPITMGDGEVIDSKNVVALTESTAYARFGADVMARKKYLVDVAYKVVEKLTASTNGDAILSALTHAVREGRIALWSAHPDEQARIASTSVGHSVPKTPGPYAAVVVNNSGASKLDYYIQKKISYHGGGCAGATRRTEVSADFTNMAPGGNLPAYVLGEDTNVPPGTNKMMVSLYATAGATLLSATADGRPLPVQSGTELGHPIYTVLIDVPPQRSVDVQYTLSEPTVDGTPEAPVQPYVAPASVTVDLPACRGSGQ